MYNQSSKYFKEFNMTKIVIFGSESTGMALAQKTLENAYEGGV